MENAHEIDVVIPKDHRLTIDVPQSVRSGPARLILLVPSENPAPRTNPEALGRWQALTADLLADARPFDALSPEERQERLGKVMGAGRGISSSSEEFARKKSTEIDLEERKIVR